jgi:hypothetical protein
MYERPASTGGGGFGHVRMRSTRGGVLLDLVIAVGLVLLAAFAFSRLGISFHELIEGARHFFGH